MTKKKRSVPMFVENADGSFSLNPVLVKNPDGSYTFRDEPTPKRPALRLIKGGRA